MRRGLGFILLALPVGLAVAAQPYEEWESAVYELPLAKQDIIQRGESCVAQYVHNDAVVLTGSANGYAGMFGGQRLGQANTIQGGDIFTLKDPENGVINATNRSDYRAYMVDFSVQSSVSLLAKDNKFKIKHSNIRILQKKAGYGDNLGYRQLNTNDPFFEKAVTTLGDLATKIADCIKAAEKNDNW